MKTLCDFPENKEALLGQGFYFFCDLVCSPLERRIIYYLQRLRNQIIPKCSLFIKGEFCHISTKTLIVRYLSFTISITKFEVLK